MVIFPKSKINLGLNILRRRPDGYHDLQTIMIPIGWSDILEIVPARNGVTSLTVTGNAVDCPVEKNLVMRAYNAVKSAVPELPEAEIFLRKIVPDGAGLGGGSADAAATVCGLNDLFALGLSKEKMAEICSSIGADCPFFVYDAPMLAEGIGTDLSEIEIPALKGLGIIVAKPDESVSTAEAYQGVQPDNTAAPLQIAAQSPIEQWREMFRNSFEESIFPTHPRIAALKEYFYRQGAIFAAMSGSGSAVFALFRGDILAAPDDVALRDCFTWSGIIE